MVTIIEYEGKRLVSSLDIYKQAGYSPCHHTRWLRDITNIAQKNIDYFEIININNQEIIFPYKNKYHTYNGKKSTQQRPCFFTIEMAIYSCIRAKTEKAKKLKLFLQLHK